MSSDKKLNVFVSYSHRDKAWLERVQVHLKPLARGGRLDLWDDTGIKAGQRWRDEIKAALAQADVAILLISADFYASDFIANNELPPLLETAQSERGLVILGVHINYSDFENDRVLSEYQTVNTPKQPIEDLESRGQQEKVFRDLARRIRELVPLRRPAPEPWLDDRDDLAPMKDRGAQKRNIAAVPELVEGAATSSRGLRFSKKHILVPVACLLALFLVALYFTVTPEPVICDLENRLTASLLNDLQSGEMEIRRRARSQLAEQGVEAVPCLLDELARNFESYPTRVGVSAALAEMLRRNKEQGPEIRDRLDERDLALLTRARDDKDGTIREHASDFLCLLDDPRVVKSC